MVFVDRIFRRLSNLVSDPGALEIPRKCCVIKILEWAREEFRELSVFHAFFTKYMGRIDFKTYKIILL